MSLAILVLAETDAPPLYNSFHMHMDNTNPVHLQVTRHQPFHEKQMRAHWCSYFLSLSMAVCSNCQMICLLNRERIPLYL